LGCSGQQKIKTGNHTFQASYFKTLNIRHLFEGTPASVVFACHTWGMTHPIDELLRKAGVPFFDTSDGTLSGGEVAIARIVDALVKDWDRLDGQQQRNLLSALEASTQATEEAEEFVRQRLREK